MAFPVSHANKACQALPSDDIFLFYKLSCTLFTPMCRLLRFVRRKCQNHIFSITDNITMYGFFYNPRINAAFSCLDAAFIGTLLPSAAFNRLNAVILLLLLLLLLLF